MEMEKKKKTSVPGHTWLERKGYHREGVCELHGTEEEPLPSSLLVRGSCSNTQTLSFERGLVVTKEKKEQLSVSFFLEIAGADGRKEKVDLKQWTTHTEIERRGRERSHGRCVGWERNEPRRFSVLVR